MITKSTVDAFSFRRKTSTATGAFRYVLLLLALCSIAACSNPANVPESPEAAPIPMPKVVEDNVRPDVNNSYKNPDLNVDMWAERFTGESREVFAQRLNVLAALDSRQASVLLI